MRPPDEQATPSLGERVAARVATKTTEDQSTRPPLTQAQRVLAMLLEADEVCGSRLYAAYIPRFAVHIHRMRKLGYVITKRPCDVHDHEGTGWLYRLEALPFDPSDGAA